MKISTTQTIKRAGVVLSSKGGDVTINKLVDIATDEIYPAEVHLSIPGRKALALAELGEAIKLLETALKIGEWLDSHLTTLDSFLEIDLPQDIDSYK